MDIDLLFPNGMSDVFHELYENALFPIWQAIEEVTDNFQLLKYIAIVIGATVGLAFMWWGVRKLVRAIMAAFKKGKVSI